MVAMEENAAQNSNKVLQVLHVLEDGDFVAVHAKVKITPQSPDIALIHLFRFDGDLLTELWDISQPQPDNSPNQYGMF
jgi:predicted SnoaL-like aldol condensation-catalyzing enzyme